jgi:hypothetical protein
MLELVELLIGSIHPLDHRLGGLVSDDLVQFS